MGEKLLLALPGLLISLVSLGMAWEARRHSRNREAVAELDALKGVQSAMSAELQVLKKQMEVFWRGVSFSSSQALHSPHTPALDALIEKFQAGRIDDEELARFKVMLEELAEDEDETAFRRKMARDVLTLIHIRYEVAAG